MSTNCSLRSCHSISVGFRSGPGLSELHSVFLQPLRRGPAGLCWIINSLQHKYRPQPETSGYLFFKKNEIFTITRKHEPLSACEVRLGAQSDGSALQASEYDISKRLIELLDHKYFRKQSKTCFTLKYCFFLSRADFSETPEIIQAEHSTSKLIMLITANLIIIIIM